MNSHNTKTENAVSNEKIRVDTDRESVRVLRSTLVESVGLAVAEDYETGGDPYNSAGRHVIIKPLTDD